MTQFHPALQYFLYTSAATISGLFYWFAAENLRETRYRFVYALSLSILFSPLGAWIVSTIMRAMQLSQGLKDPDRHHG